MQNFGSFISKYGIENLGIKNPGTVYWNLTGPMLYEQSIRRREGVIGHLGPLVVHTGDHTGRSANDKFIVKEPTSENDIWWGEVNSSISQENFDRLFRKMRAYIQNRDIFVFNDYAGADPTYRMPVRVISEFAWHNLFARNMFIRELDPEKLVNHVPEFTVINMPRFHAEPEFDGTNSQTFILIDFGKRLVLIGGTEYAGEIKKSIFTALNYYLPKRGTLSMHCSANYGDNRNETAVFFGLSGTGKTTLVKALTTRNPELRFSISYTTRPKRRNEAHAVDYLFVDTAEFESLREQGALLESAEVFDNFYGTSREQV